MRVRPQEQESRNNEYYLEPEINLSDYVHLLWKWKWMIIIGTIICALAAIMYNHFRPSTPTFKVSALIELDPRLNDLEKIKTDIKSSSFNDRIIKELTHLNFKGTQIPQSIEFKVDVLPNMLLVSCEIPDETVGKAVLNLLIEQLRKQQRDKIEKVKSELETRALILTKKGFEIANVENEIKMMNARREITKVTIDYIQRRIKQVGVVSQAVSNTESKDAFEMPADLSLANRKEIDYLVLNQEDLLASLMNIDYSIQNRKGMASILKAEHKILIKEKQRLENSPEMLPFREELAHMRSIAFKKTPSAELLPKKFNTKRNAFASGVLGFFVFAIVAFLIEYLKNAFRKNASPRQQHSLKTESKNF